MPPTVSIVMSVFNGSRYLGEAVESLLAQTFTDFELVIVDDASTDATPSMLRHYAEKDERIRVLTNETNMGLTRSLNRGLGAAAGEYIARQDADDISLPERLEVQVAHLEANPGVAMVATGVNWIDEDGRGVGRWVPSTNPMLLGWALMFGNPIRHSAVLWRRQQVADAVGGYDPDFVFAQDYDLWTRMLDRGLRIVALAPCVVSMRTHSTAISQLKKEEQDRSALRVVCRQVRRYFQEDGLSEADVIAVCGISSIVGFQTIERQTLHELSLGEQRRCCRLYLELVSNYYAGHQADTGREDKADFLDLIEDEMASHWTSCVAHGQRGCSVFLLKECVKRFPRRTITCLARALTMRLGILGALARAAYRGLGRILMALRCGRIRLPLSTGRRGSGRRT